MLVERRVIMSWRRVGESLHGLVAHTLLFSFTLLLALKLQLAVPYSWWVIFAPLWLFHAVTARGRFSLPAPAMPHDRNWAPMHAILATPLLMAFELLLCIHLEGRYAVDLKVVFMPLIAFEMTILIDNISMCRALMPGDEENMSDEQIWETLPHFWVAISMVFFIAATVFTLMKLCGDVAALGWWDLFINYGIAQCFAFLVCTKWYNPLIHAHSYTEESSSSSASVRYLDWNRSLIISSDEDPRNIRMCNLQDIGGHFMKIPLIVFQIMLFMRLEGTPAGARHIPIPCLFAPLFMIQGTGVLFAAYRLVEKIVLLLSSGACTGSSFYLVAKAKEFLGFLRHGSRLLGWWSIDEGSREEQARLYHGSTSSYNTFSPDCVRKMLKSELVDEIWKLQAVLSEQMNISKFSQEEYERLQNVRWIHKPFLSSFSMKYLINISVLWTTKIQYTEIRCLCQEKILCRICFEEQINVVILPCRHHALCGTCCEKCKKCPICRVVIEERMPVCDV